MPAGGELAARVGFRAIPYTLVVGRDGVVRFAEMGFNKSKLDELRGILEDALAAKA